MKLKLVPQSLWQKWLEATVPPEAGSASGSRPRQLGTTSEGHRTRRGFVLPIRCARRNGFARSTQGDARDASSRSTVRYSSGEVWKQVILKSQLPSRVEQVTRRLQRSVPPSVVTHGSTD